MTASKGLSQIWTESGIWALHHESTDCLFCTPRSDFQVEAPALTFTLRFGHLRIAGPQKEWQSLLFLCHYPIWPHNHFLFRPQTGCFPQTFPSATPAWCCGETATMSHTLKQILSCQGSLGMLQRLAPKLLWTFYQENEPWCRVSWRVFCRTRRVRVEKKVLSHLNLELYRLNKVNHKAKCILMNAEP